MEIKTLYGLDKKGGFKVWTILTNGNILSIQHGKEGGKMQIKNEEIEGKNIGRANETTPAEQAELEAMSRWRKQIDKGYRETKEELEELPLLPMLAQDYLKQGHRIKYPCYGSPKLDGVRCLAIRHPHRVELKSRGGKQYTVIHIEEQLMRAMKPGEVWDGELYIHGKYLEEIVSCVKKINDETHTLQFIIFDVVTDDCYEDRLVQLQQIRNHQLNDVEVTDIGVIRFCELQDEEHMKQKHKEYVSQGYEGIMLRNYDGQYESGKRSADLQKYKEFFDEEFEIVNVGPDRDGHGVLYLYDHVSGNYFTCTYGDHHQRVNQVRFPYEYIGKALTVKYQTRYKDSRLPQFPTGVRIREGKWVDSVFIPSE